MIKIETPSGKSRTKAPSKIIIHAMSEYLDHEGRHVHATNFLNLVGLSCHYMITPGGDTIQCADHETRTTWHARGHNHDSIGIEVLVPGLNTYEEFLKEIKRPWVSERQLDGLVELLLFLPRLKMYRHCDVDPTRKFDPGEGFPWESLISKIR